MATPTINFDHAINGVTIFPRVRAWQLIELAERIAYDAEPPGDEMRDYGTRLAEAARALAAHASVDLVMVEDDPTDPRSEPEWVFSCGGQSVRLRCACPRVDYDHGVYDTPWLRAAELIWFACFHREFASEPW